MALPSKGGTARNADVQSEASGCAPFGVALRALAKRHTDRVTAGEHVDDLLSGKQVAVLLGWKSPGIAWQLHVRGTFPAPVRVDRPRLWRRADVEDWARTHPRRPHRRQDLGQI